MRSFLGFCKCVRCRLGFGLVVAAAEMATTTLRFSFLLLLLLLLLPYCVNSKTLTRDGKRFIRQTPQSAPFSFAYC
jgi:hypothetical protein